MSSPSTAAPIPFWRLAIPSLVTLGNATCGFAAILQLTTGSAGGGQAALSMAAWLIQAGWIFDMCDGMVARTLKANGPFGAQLDSLCDVITFGLAPAVLLVTATGGGWLGCLAGLAYLWAAVVRLARFTVESGNDAEGHLYFSGLPSPVAAALITGLYLAQAHLLTIPLPGVEPATAHGLAAELASGLPLAAVTAAMLMVSRLRYPDMPKHYLKGIKPRWHLAGLAVAAWFLSPALTIAVYFTLYTLAGMLGPALDKMRRQP
jgi:CDP-diacylglycerol--serine O-phosphatidyltransferase